VVEAEVAGYASPDQQGPVERRVERRQRAGDDDEHGSAWRRSADRDLGALDEAAVEQGRLGGNGATVDDQVALSGSRPGGDEVGRGEPG
jgi:hypothetical protein